MLLLRRIRLLAAALALGAALAVGWWSGRASAPAASPTETEASEPVERKILYYRNPMGLPDTSPVPKKDSMGMDYLPVFADEAPPPEPGTVVLAPDPSPISCFPLIARHQINLTSLVPPAVWYPTVLAVFA